jgi:hypothetical protein
MKTNTTQSTQAVGNMVSFDVWLNSLNRTRCTGWRWRRSGLINTQNVFGKIYITREEIARFEARAMAGEFHKKAAIPCVKNAEQKNMAAQ